MRTSLILLIVFFKLLYLLPLNKTLAQTINVITLQSNVTCALPGDNNVPVIVVKVTVSGGIPISAYALFLSTDGSNNPSVDITNAKIFYTGNSNIFNTATQYGPLTSNPNGFFTINNGTSFTLTQGDNYFWVAYDVSLTAATGDTLDAICTSVYLSNGTYTPTIISPAGQIIIGCTTGIESINASGVKLYPNPVSDKVTLEYFVPTENAQFIIYNTTGNKVYEADLNIKQVPFSFNTSELKPAAYYYIIKANGVILATGKLMIVR